MPRGRAELLQPHQHDEDREDIQPSHRDVFFCRRKAAAREPEDTKRNGESHEQAETFLCDLPLHGAAPGCEFLPAYPHRVPNEHREREGKTTPDETVERKHECRPVLLAIQVGDRHSEDADDPTSAVISKRRREAQSACPPRASEDIAKKGVRVWDRRPRRSLCGRSARGSVTGRDRRTPVRHLAGGLTRLCAIESVMLGYQAIAQREVH